jgi:hypothetical protein
MNILKFVNFPVFFISLAVGMFFVYIFKPENHTIFVYPTPDNVDTIQYKDPTGTCFSVEQTKVSCPKDNVMISKLPAQN